MQQLPTALLAVAMLVCVPSEAWAAKAKKDKPKDAKAAAGATLRKPAKPLDPGPVYKVPVDLRRDGFKGNPDALVTWVIFGDMQDPYGNRFRRSIRKAREYFGADLRVVYKHFPLSWHRQAWRTSEAALCAREHDLFWEFHDWMVERRGAAAQRPEKMLANARAAGLAGKALEEFARCVTSRRFDKRVADDVALGNKVGVRGIPYSYINGRLVRGAVRYDLVREVIERELTAARAFARSQKLADRDVYQQLIAKGQHYSRLDTKVEKLPREGAAVLATARKPKHVLTTFVDFGSVWSRRVLHALMRVQQAHPDEVTLLARHYPMGREGARRPMSRAAGCAQAQGRFWEFAKVTSAPDFRVPAKPTAADWRAIAKKAGVGSIQGFDVCITSGASDPAMLEDIELARRLRASSGSIFLDGRRWGGTADQLVAYLYPDLAKPEAASGSGAEVEAKRKQCEADPTACAIYASLLATNGAPGPERWKLRIAALERGCKADHVASCRELATSYREGNGVAFDEKRVQALRAKVCTISKGKYDCPPKPKKKRYDPRMDFFNPGLR